MFSFETLFAPLLAQLIPINPGSTLVYAAACHVFAVIYSQVPQRRIAALTQLFLPDKVL